MKGLFSERSSTVSHFFIRINLPPPPPPPRLPLDLLSHLYHSNPISIILKITIKIHNKGYTGFGFKNLWTNTQKLIFVEFGEKPVGVQKFAG